MTRRGVSLPSLTLVTVENASAGQGDPFLPPVQSEKGLRTGSPRLRRSLTAASGVQMLAVFMESNRSQLDERGGM